MLVDWRFFSRLLVVVADGLLFILVFFDCLFGWVGCVLLVWG